MISEEFKGHSLGPDYMVYKTDELIGDSKPNYIVVSIVTGRAVYTWEGLTLEDAKRAVSTGNI